MTQLDPRLNAYREDLAAAPLQNKVRAARYTEGELRQIAAPAAPIRVAPKFDAALATEALSGELLTVYEIREGWAWVQLREDGYVGYTTVDNLSGLVEENTHRVSSRLTYLYPAPDMKRPPIAKLSFSCTVAPIGRPEGRFCELSRGGFIFADHIVGIRERAKDYVRVAERFVGAPYLWGGKTTLGIDCSGLVQISLRAAGVICPRDSDMQLASMGEPIDVANLDNIQRGDLLFWKGHVAIAQSADWMLHASGHHMEVVVEQIRRAIERTSESHGPLIAVLRPVMEQPAPAPQAQIARGAPATEAKKAQPAAQAASSAQPPESAGAGQSAAQGAPPPGAGKSAPPSGAGQSSAPPSGAAKPDERQPRPGPQQAPANARPEAGAEPKRPAPPPQREGAPADKAASNERPEPARPKS